MEDIRRQEVRQLAQLTARLAPTQQIFFQAEYSLHRRSPTTAFLLCVLLGDFGAHYFYFGRYRAGVVRLLFCWTLVPAVLALFDARTMTARARRYNASLANELVLAIEGAVEEQDHVPAGMVDSAQQMPTVDGRGRRPALAAPVSTPEMEAIAAAAWMEREPQPDDPRDPPISLEHPDESEHAIPDEAHWPNELAHPVQPQRYALAEDEPPGEKPSEMDEQIPAWPVAASWLDEARAYPALTGDAAIPLADDAIMLDGATDEAPDEARDEIGATREPVMLYQVAPMPRRESVHVEPPPPAAYLHDEEVQMGATDDPRLTNAASGENGTPKGSRVGHDEAAIAALGSALASGLAELLRDRPHPRPLTRPITRPITQSNPQPVAPPATTPEPLEPPEASAPVSDYPDLVASIGDSVRDDSVAVDHTTLTEQSDHTDLAPLALSTAFAAGIAPESAEDIPRDAYAVDTTYGATPLAPISQYVPAEPITQPDDASWSLGPLAHAAPLIATPMALEPATTLFPEAVPPPTNPMPAAVAPQGAFNLRRRVVQRVIVRKMAVLDGKVVAEATVERQVPVIHDDAEMAARIRMATRDAAREALGYLLIQAPEEARPSIREQLEAMRQPVE